MANIAFVLNAAIASFNSSLKLAKDQVARGHQVCYITLADSEDRVRANGMDVAIVYKAWFPRGTAHNFDEMGSLGGYARIKALRAAAIRHRKFLEAVLNGQETDFQDTIENLKPDLMIHMHASSLMVVAALLAHSFGIKAIYLHDILGIGADPVTPPVWTGIIPTASLWSRVRIAMAWKRAICTKYVRKLYAWYDEDSCQDLLKKVALKCGYPWSCIDTGGLPPYASAPRTCVVS